MYLVLALREVDGKIFVDAITGASKELHWDAPFWLERKIVTMPWWYRRGAKAWVQVLRCPDATPNVGYIYLGS